MSLLENIILRMIRKSLVVVLLIFGFSSFRTESPSWIRINLAGYKPQGLKVAVWGSRENVSLQRFQLVDKVSGKVVYEHKAGKAYGSYGPFAQSYRLDFTSFKNPGTYILRA